MNPPLISLGQGAYRRDYSPPDRPPLQKHLPQSVTRCTTHFACECLRWRLALLMRLERAARDVLRDRADVGALHNALAAYDEFDLALREEHPWRSP